MAILPSNPLRKVNISLLTVIGFILLIAIGLISVYNLIGGTSEHIWGWIFFASLLMLAVVLVGGAATMDAPWWEPRQGAVIPAFVASACLVPGVAAVMAIMAYLSGRNAQLGHWTMWVREYAVLLGLVAALGIWPLLALLCRRFTRADSSNPRTYNELIERLRKLRARVEVLDGGPKPQLEQLAYAEARSEIDAIEEVLQREGMQWVSLTGYIDVWNRIHRAEEALLHIEPTELVVSEALYDEWCIKDSTIQNRDDLLSKLRFARKVLSRSKCFDENAPPLPSPHLPLGVALTPKQVQQSQQALKQEQALREHERRLRENDRREQEAELRAILCQVHRSRNEFRDDSREGLVRARNRLFKTGVVTGIAGFVLLSLAIIMDAGDSVIIATVAFYLVGAILGLFNRLLSEADNDQAIDDYGLTTARLIHTPLFSGLAAVGGVVLVAMLPILLNPEVISPQATDVGVNTAAVAGNGTAEASRMVNERHVPLDDIFNLERYPFGIIVAAIFGLTPGLLISRLQSQTDKYKLDLKSTQASERDSRIAG